MSAEARAVLNLAIVLGSCVLWLATGFLLGCSWQKRQQPRTHLRVVSVLDLLPEDMRKSLLKELRRRNLRPTNPPPPEPEESA